MSAGSRSAAEWIDVLGTAAYPAARTAFAFGDCRVELRTNSVELCDRLRAYYGEFVDDSPGATVSVVALEAPPPHLDLPFQTRAPDPGKRSVKEEFVDFPDGRVIRKRRTGMVFAYAGDRHLAYGPCLANDNQVVNFLNNRYIEWLLDRGYILGHAAAVTRGARGLALAGVSSAGKSTLALHLAAAGLDFVSNDRVLLRRERERVDLRGVPKLPRVNPGTLLHNPRLRTVLTPEARTRAAALSEPELWALEDKHDVHLTACFGPGRFRLATTLTALVIVSWRRGVVPFRIRPVDLGERRDLLGALMKPVGLFYHAPLTAPRPEPYLENLRSVPTFAIEGGVDFAGASEACLRLLEPPAAGNQPAWAAGRGAR